MLALFWTTEKRNRHNQGNDTYQESYTKDSPISYTSKWYIIKYSMDFFVAE